MKIKRKVVLFILGVLTVPLLAYMLMPDWLPSESEIRGCLTTQMYQVHLCPGSKGYVPLSQIASVLQKTIVLTEDSGFYDHHGFDWKSIEQNARRGWATGSFKRGGSSISQQLAKNMFLSKERSFWRKAKEAIITDRLENTLSKEEILERYLNVIEFGKDIYGIKTAANYYFKKIPAQLDAVESAFLAMLLPNPIKYSQSYYNKSLTPFAQSRMDKIISDMYHYNRITEEQYLIASEKLSWFFKPSSPPIGEDIRLTEEEMLDEHDEFEVNSGLPTDNSLLHEKDSSNDTELEQESSNPSEPNSTQLEEAEEVETPPTRDSMEEEPEIPVM